MTSAPLPSTAMVTPPPSSAPSWAQVSTPRARPLTTQTFSRAKAAANSRAARLPSRVARREPTMANVRSLSSDAPPRTYNAGGGS